MKKIFLLLTLCTMGVMLSAQTYKEWKAMAESGDYKARCRYAYMTFVGDGCKADEEKGRYMLEDLRGEYLDTSEAAYLYAFSYTVGKEPDWETGISIMKELLVEDNIYAYRGLADVYLKSKYRHEDSARYYVDELVKKEDAYGLYVKGMLQIEGKVYDKDLKLGVANLERSAELSNRYACSLLGEIYQYGKYGVDSDVEKACSYYYKAPSKQWNSVEVQLSLSSIYVQNNQVDSLEACGNRLLQLGRDEGYFLLGNAERLKGNINQMIVAYESGAKKKNKLCLETLGDVYSSGDLVNVDDKKARKYYEEANTATANYSLAKMLMGHEDRSEDDYRKGFAYLKQSANSGNEKAIYDVAYIYEYGTKYTKINYDSAMVYLNYAADDGNVDAMYILGMNYEYGRGVSVNKGKALQYIKEAINQGNHATLCVVGEYFRLGLGGLEKDCDSAYSYFQKAEKYGIDEALYYIACCYLEGCGVNRDTAAAMNYLKKIVQKEDIKFVGEAYTQLGNLYKKYSPIVNSDSALNYYRKAISYGSGDGCYELGVYMMNEGDESAAIDLFVQGIKLGSVDCMIIYAENLTQHANGDKDMLKESYKLYEQVAMKYNDARGYVGLGLCLLKGIGCPKDEFAGVANLEIAAKMGNASGQYYTGVAYMTGLGCDMNIKTALNWIELSAKQNDANAINMLGDLCIEGTLIKKDVEKGFEYYKYAAEHLGSLEAYCNMGECYENGIGVVMNKQKAFVSYQMAAQYNYARGQFLLGNSYRKGIFVKIDMNEAMKWYKLAANQQYGEALYCLGEIYEQGLDGVEIDKKLAKEYFQKASSIGYIIEEE